MRSTVAGRRSLTHSFDWKIVILYISIVLIGWINIYASIHTADGINIFDWSARSGKQAIWILTALGLAAVILFVINARLWESAAIPIYLSVLALLVAVIFLGIDVKGSRSWFEFGPIRFQPAEISKISTSIMLAYIMSRNNFKITRFWDFVKVALIIFIPIVVILAENETGSALVYVGFIFMLYREGISGWLLFMGGVCVLIFILTLTATPFTSALVLLGILFACNVMNVRRWKWMIILTLTFIALAFIPTLWNMFLDGTEEESFWRNIKPLYLLVGIGILSLPFIIRLAYKSKNRFIYGSILSFFAGVCLILSTEFIFNNVLKDHQRKRIEVLLGLKEDPSGVGYNVNQSMIAIGSGGFTGKGFLNGTQTTYGFVPEQSTDFIFCTVGEEWGFVGCFAVIALYVMLIWRIIRNSERSRENFTRIYGYCVACCLFMHLFINIGMTVGLMPVIGIPLPLMSYGGSSLWSFTVLIFIFVVLDHEERKYF